MVLIETKKKIFSRNALLRPRVRRTANPVTAPLDSDAILDFKNYHKWVLRCFSRIYDAIIIFLYFFKNEFFLFNNSNLHNSTIKSI